MRPPRALLVDLNETLLDGCQLSRAVSETCAELAASGFGLSADQLLQANSDAWSRLWPASEPDWSTGRITGTELSLEAWRRTLRGCGCDDDSAAEMAAERHAAYALAAVRLFEDVHDFVSALSGKLPLGIVSNGASDDQRRLVASFDLAPWFDPIVISADVGIAKPDPAIFGVALRRLGLSPGEVWHIGDSLQTDVAGAAAAGITAVWLNRTGRPRAGGSPQPHMEIASLREVAPAIGL